MKCDICHKNEASVFIEDVYKQKVSKRHICMHCAMGLLAMKITSSPLGNLLNMIKSNSNKNNSFNIDKKDFVCPECGTNYEDVERNQKVGCAECYVTFKDFLEPVIFPNGYRFPYRGKYPMNMQKSVNHHKKMAELKSELENLLAFEDYEKAAKVRDEIKKEKKRYHK